MLPDLFVEPIHRGRYEELKPVLQRLANGRKLDPSHRPLVAEVHALDTDAGEDELCRILDLPDHDPRTFLKPQQLWDAMLGLMEACGWSHPEGIGRVQVTFHDALPNFTNARWTPAPFFDGSRSHELVPYPPGLRAYALLERDELDELDEALRLLPRDGLLRRAYAKELEELRTMLRDVKARRGWTLAFRFNPSDAERGAAWLAPELEDW